jgi:hypothetical protein
MAFIAINQILGEVDLTAIDTAGPGLANLTAGTGSGRQNFYLQTVSGYDPNLGGGEFAYMRFSGTIAAGTVCETTPSISGGIVIQNATAWAGTAVSGRPLAVAVSAGTVGQFGWFQVQGNAVRPSRARQLPATLLIGRPQASFRRPVSPASRWSTPCSLPPFPRPSVRAALR